MKYVSSKYIVGRVMREFKLKQISNHISDIHEWIGEACEMIRVSTALVKKSSPNEGETGALMVSSHRVAIPSDFVDYFYVEYQGLTLPLGGDKSGFGLPNHSRTTDIRTGSKRYGSLIYEDGTPVSDTDFQRPALYNGEYHLMNDDYIQTSFEEGHIKLHYLALPVDDCGFPMIPDKAFYKQAAVWYVIRNLLGQGYKHPVFSYEYADQKFEEFMPRAQNQLKAPNAAQMELFRKLWVRMIPLDNLPTDFFAGAETGEIIDI